MLFFILAPSSNPLKFLLMEELLIKNNFNKELINKLTQNHSFDSIRDMRPSQLRPYIPEKNERIRLMKLVDNKHLHRKKKKTSAGVIESEKPFLDNDQKNKLYKRKSSIFQVDSFKKEQEKGLNKRQKNRLQ